jgi:CRP-like cAMP-binding protein
MADLDHRSNQLLAALSEPGFDQLRDFLHPVDLVTGQILIEPGTTITDVYFPRIGVVSLVADLGNNQIVEVATVGDEGMVGAADVPGHQPTHRTRHRPGRRHRAAPTRRRPPPSRRDHRRLPTGRVAALQAMFTHLLRNVACNLAHNLRQRCARWLLMTADRMHADSFDLTQEFLAQMLAVRRASVSAVAGALADDGSLSYRRGRITIRDRERLQADACDCYTVIRDVFATAYRGLGTP